MFRHLALIPIVLCLGFAQTNTQLATHPPGMSTTVVGDLNSLTGQTIDLAKNPRVEISLKNCPGYLPIEAKASPDSKGKVNFTIRGNDTLACPASYYLLKVFQDDKSIYERVYFINGPAWDLNKNTFSYTQQQLTGTVTIGSPNKIPVLYFDRVTKRTIGFFEADPVFKASNIDPFEKHGSGTFQMFSGAAARPNELVKFNPDGSISGTGVLVDNLLTTAGSSLPPGGVLFADANGGMTADTSGLFYNATLKRLGIGKASPQYALDVSGEASVDRLRADSITASTITGNLSGNAATATALAADPGDCPAGQVATGVDRFGNLTCTSMPAGSGIKYAVDFVSQTSVAVPGTSHLIGNADLSVTCYDTSSPRRRVEPDTLTVEAATNNVVITFAVPQSGRCFVQ